MECVIIGKFFKEAFIKAIMVKKRSVSEQMRDISKESYKTSRFNKTRGMVRRILGNPARLAPDEITYHVNNLLDRYKILKTKRGKTNLGQTHHDLDPIGVGDLNELLVYADKAREEGLYNDAKTALGTAYHLVQEHDKRHKGRKDVTKLKKGILRRIYRVGKAMAKDPNRSGDFYEFANLGSESELDLSDGGAFQQETITKDFGYLGDFAKKIEKDLGAEQGMSGLVKKIAAPASLLCLAGSLLFIGFSITGNAIADFSVKTNSMLGISLFVAGLVAGSFWIDSQK